MEEITTLIGQYCFPICACVALFLENRAQRNSHQTEMDKFAKVIEANTLAVTKLITLFEREE